jgi:methylmalonyl-CoA mutase cobalamin-binding subunit
MHRIGERWPDDPKGVFLEHRATNICVDALNRLRTNFPNSAATEAIALGGAPERDPYLLPSLMATTVLADVGLRPVNLGPNTPLAVLAQSAVELGARLIWIALTSPLPKAALESAVSEMLATLGKTRIQVVMGGQAAKRFRIPDHPRVHTFDTMTEMAGFAKGLLATRQTG